MSKLDHFDRMILRELQQDAQQKYTELSKKVNLSAPAIHERVKQLKKNGIIKNVSAIIDTNMLGLTITAFLLVDLMYEHCEEISLKMAKLPELEEINSVSGDTSVIIKARCQSTEHLEDLLYEINRIPGVNSTKSYITLKNYLNRVPMIPDIEVS